MLGNILFVLWVSVAKLLDPTCICLEDHIIFPKPDVRASVCSHCGPVHFQVVMASKRHLRIRRRIL